MNIEKIQYSHGKPFLSIITRVYKRPKGLSANIRSIAALTDKDIEQIFMHDEIGIGMLEANKSFFKYREHVAGEYVYLLDDDDFIVNTEMVQELKAIAIEENHPDIIFFRMTIKNGMNNNHYPTATCWGIKPMIAHIGGSCFVVKREKYLKFIEHFGQARCGDFYFINQVFNDPGTTYYWHDNLMAETGKVSRGAAE